MNSACGQCRNIADCTGFYACDSTTHSCVCKQKTSGNKLANPGFDVSSGLGSWVSDSIFATASYSTDDSDGCPGSGSAYVQGMSNLWQCISSNFSDVSYAVGFRFHGAANCSLSFYSATNCGGTYLDGDDLGSPWSSTSWWPVSVYNTAPTSTQSVEIFCSGAGGDGYFDQFYFNTGGGTF